MSIESFYYKNYKYYTIKSLKKKYKPLLDTDSRSIIIGLLRARSNGLIVLHCNKCNTFYKEVTCSPISHIKYMIGIVIDYTRDIISDVENLKSVFNNFHISSSSKYDTKSMDTKSMDKWSTSDKISSSYNDLSPHNDNILSTLMSMQYRLDYLQYKIENQKTFAEASTQTD